MGGYKIEEAGFVLGVAKAAEVLNAGFRDAHASETQYGGHNFAVVSYAAEAGASSDRA